MNLHGALLGIALFTLSGAFILSAFVVKSLRNRYTGGHTLEWRHSFCYCLPVFFNRLDQICD
jgi:hypothetical protein